MQPLFVTMLGKLLLLVGVSHFCFCIPIESYPALKTICSQHGSKEGEFEHVSLDKSDHVFVGGWNAIFVYRTKDLRLVTQVDTGPNLDSEKCPPDPTVNCTCPASVQPSECITYQRQNRTSVNTGLLVVTEINSLVACSNLYHGSCLSISLPDFKVLSPHHVPVTSSDVNRSRVMFSGPCGGSSCIYVALSHQISHRNQYSDNIPLISSRNALTFGLSNNLSTVAMLPTFADTVAVEFIGGFSYNGYSYFLQISEKQVNQASVVRICQNDSTFSSYIEMDIACGVEDETKYRMRSSNIIIENPSSPDHKNTTGVDNVLVITCYDTANSKAVISLFPLKKMEENFNAASESCFSGKAEQGPDYLTNVRPCIISDDSSKYCGETGLNKFIKSADIMTPAKIYTAPHDMDTSHVVGKWQNNYLVLYYGNTQETGRVMEMIISPADEIQIISSTSLDNADGLKEMLLDPDQDNLYTVSKSQICKIALNRDCHDYQSCSACSASSPDCTWCYTTDSCVRASDCPGLKNSFGTTCPTITKIYPRQVSVQFLSGAFLAEKSKFEVEVDTPVALPVTCMVEVNGMMSTSNAQLSPDLKKISCDQLTGTLFSLTTENMLVNLTIQHRGNYFAATEISVYDCAKITRCDSCTSAKFSCEVCSDNNDNKPAAPCTWCPYIHSCVHESNVHTECIKPLQLMPDKSGNEANEAVPEPLTLRRLPAPSNNTVEDAKYCPAASPGGPNILRAHTGAQVNLTFEVLYRRPLEVVCRGSETQLQPFQAPLVCRVRMEDVILSKFPPTILAGGSMAETYSCMLNLDGVTNTTLHVDLIWGEDKAIDMNDLFYVEVYNCKRFGNNCGMCLMADASEGCGWCDNRCTARDVCSTTWLSPTDTCPDPQITSFSPLSGPLNGGTNLTIVGINLGKSLDEVNVNIGDLPCELSARSQPPLKIICTTSNTSTSMFGLVHVSVAGQYNTSSNEQFGYLEAKVKFIDITNGPIAGGTHVRLEGLHMNMGTSGAVRVNSVLADVVGRGPTYLEFLTPPALDQAIGEATIQVLFDNQEAIMEPGIVFHYLDNPTITSMDPMTALYSGGTSIQVNGSNFEIIERPLFRVMDHDGHTSETACSISDAKTTLTCPFPDMSTHHKISSVYQTANYTIVMDGVKFEELLPNLKPMMFYPTPIIDNFPGDDRETGYYEDQAMKITGQHMDSLKYVEGLTILVNDKPCVIVQINDSYILCNPPPPPKRISLDNKLAVVTMTLGMFKAQPGNLDYQPKDKSHISMAMIIGILVGVSIPLCCLITMLLMCLRSHCRKQRHREHVERAGNIKREDHDLEMEPVRMRNRPHISDPTSPVSPGTVASYASGLGEDMEMTPLTAGLERENSMDENCDMRDDCGSPQLPPREIQTEDEREDDSDEWDDEDEEQNDSQDTGHFELHALLEQIGDPKLRADVKAVFIPRDRLDMKNLLGKGHFGCVYAADLKDIDGNAIRPVAVKTLQGTSLDTNATQNFLQEGVIMRNFEHPHVLSLLGVCIEGNNPMVVLPYMANGDLRSFIKEKKRTFTARQLLHLCQQVAQGMAYLSALHFVHRDLAARNCMIDENSTVKVADFGLSREMYEKDYYHNRDKKGKLPIKWMALESLQDLVFTTKSDVWSFGILMWEVMTRGVPPYPDVDVFDLRHYLTSGRRLYQPKYCPDNVYQIMLDCWNENPHRRPTFTDLVNTIELMLNPQQHEEPEEEEEEEPMYMNITRPESREYLNPATAPSTHGEHSGPAPPLPPPRV